MEKLQIPSIKDLIKDNHAEFKYYITGHGVLVYAVEYDGKRWEFAVPINDLAGATISAKEKAISLMRFIRKASDKGQLNAFPLHAPKGDASIGTLACFSHYRAEVLYYEVEEGDKKYLLPIRIEELAELNEDKLYASESVELFHSFIEGAKAANEFHPC